MATVNAQIVDALRVPSLKKKVIVADDVSFNRLILSRILVKLGYEVLEASTGQQAVQAFREHRSEEEEEGGLLCVLMDINMPEMDGLEASMRIRQLEAEGAERPQTSSGDWAVVPHGTEYSDRDSSCDADAPFSCTPPRRVPIWAVSACSETEQYCSPALAHVRPEACEGPPWKLAGIDAFVVKPVNPSQLTEMIAQLQARSSEYLARQPSRAELAVRWQESKSPLKRSLSPSPEVTSPVKRHNSGHRASGSDCGCLSAENRAEASADPVEDPSRALSAVAVRGARKKSLYTGVG